MVELRQLRFQLLEFLEHKFQAAKIADRRNAGKLGKNVVDPASHAASAGMLKSAAKIVQRLSRQPQLACQRGFAPSGFTAHGQQTSNRSFSLVDRQRSGAPAVRGGTAGTGQFGWAWIGGHGRSLAVDHLSTIEQKSDRKVIGAEIPS